MARDPLPEIIAYNKRFKDRYPDLLRQKIDRMAGSPFGFFRGTFHLFARDIINGVLDPWQNANPFTVVETDLVGDIHSENYGTYKADDGSIRFDINDFDETTRGSFDFDVKRAAASLFLATGDSGVAWRQAICVVDTFVRTYAEKIVRFANKGNAETFGYSDANPPAVPAVKKAIREAVDRSRPQFINSISILRGAHREILRTPKYFDLRQEHRAQAERLLRDYVHRRSQRDDEGETFFQIEDVSGRVAGCGSLGRLRYAVLVVGDGSEKAKNVLLEIKESLPSAYDEYRDRETSVTDRRNRAAEVVRVEQAMQTVSNRFLGVAIDGDVSFQVKEITPRDRRIQQADLKGADDFEACAGLYAELLAKCHAKADARDGRPGQARLQIAAALNGREEIFIKRVTAFALAYAELVEEDHRRLVAERSMVEREMLGTATSG